jgi:hypothetical protein
MQIVEKQQQQYKRPFEEEADISDANAGDTSNLNMSGNSTFN